MRYSELEKEMPHVLFHMRTLVSNFFIYGNLHSLERGNEALSNMN